MMPTCVLVVEISTGRFLINARFIDHGTLCCHQAAGASRHNGDLRRAAHGHEPTRKAAMAAFAKSWRRT